MKAIVGVVLPRKITRNFASIGKFAKVGDRYLASASKRNGKCFHITLDGKPAYTEQYDMVGPFIEVGNGRYLAVVEKFDGSESGKSAFHITPDGKPAYSDRYDWVTNFMEELDGTYYALGGFRYSPVAALYGGHDPEPCKIGPGPYSSPGTDRS